MERTESPGMRLRECRKAAKLTQIELADLVNDMQERRTCNDKAISSVENGGRLLSAEYAHLFGKVLGVTPEYLLCESDFKNENDRMLHASPNKIADTQAWYDAAELYFGALGFTVEEDGADVSICREQRIVKTISQEEFTTLCRNIFHFAQFKIERFIEWGEL